MELLTFVLIWLQSGMLKSFSGWEFASSRITAVARVQI